MSEYIVDTFGIVQDFADLHGDMSTPLYQAIMNVMLSRQQTHWLVFFKGGAR